MNGATSRLPHLLLASAITFAVGAAPAVSAADPVAPRDAATGSAHGKRMYKPYTATTSQDMTAPAGATCPAADAGTVKVASDPEEGGQVARLADAAKVQPLASDPEEGGQVARTAKPKPTVNDITVMKTSDKSSPALASAQGAPGCGSTQP